MKFGRRAGRLALVATAAIAIGGWFSDPAAAITQITQRSPQAEQQTPAPVTDPSPGLAGMIGATAAHESTLTIRTAPPLAGVRLTLDGTTVVTDEAGTASASEGPGSQSHTLTLKDTDIQTPDKRYTFARWVGQRDPDQAFKPTLDGPSLRAGSTLTAAFSVQHALVPRFLDQNGQVVDPARVSVATARSDTGAVVSIAPTGPTWLVGTRVSTRGNQVQLQDATYSWQSVVVSGTNVVDAGKQTFTPSTTPQVTVVGQFHDLTVIGYDALLGHGDGDQAVVTFPDGTVQTAPLDGAHTAVLPHLPRGTYQVTIAASGSIVGDHQVRLSRDVTLRAPVISPVDMAVLAGSFILVAAGLVLAGRRHVRRRLIAPFRPAAVAEVEAR